MIVPRPLFQTFTYEVPPSLADRVRAGSQVEVPFGRERVRGVVVAISGTAAPPPGRVLRSIAGVLDEDPLEPDLPGDLLALARQVAERYVAPWGSCLRLILPPWSPTRVRLRYRLTEAGRQALLRTEDLPARLRPVLEHLAPARAGITAETLARRTGLTSGRMTRTLRDLADRGWVDRSEHSGARRRSRAAPPPDASARLPGLAGSTTTGWLACLTAALEAHHPDALLLQGRTPDRLPALLDACDAALRRGRSAILVTPEIGRAVHVAALAAARWGPYVALLHSRLTDAQRRDLWVRIRAGQARLVIGTRAGVFAPLPSLGVLCVDEEEQAALKDEQEPRYHARDVAWLRAEARRAVLVLGSAHPSLETLARLPADRIYPLSGSPAPAPVQVVDLRDHPSDQPLTPVLADALRSAYGARTGVLLYLNRKGFASAVLCRDCGTVVTCPRCQVTLRYYRDGGDPGQPRLRCLYCGGGQPAPEICAACRSPRIQPVGYGTARLEEEVRRLLPRARIGRIDADTTRGVGAKELWRTASVGGFDVLIGTEMLFHGPPLPPVGLVGLPHADAGFHLPDFRAAERTYQGLLDAVTAARPADEGGSIVLQTYLPSHHVVAALAEHRPELFYGAELDVRRAAGYPPFGSLIDLCVSGIAPSAVRDVARGWAEALLAEAGDALTVLGPVAAPISRLRDRYRMQILVKAAHAEVARAAVAATRPRVEASAPRGIRCDVDVDPIDLL